MNIHEFKLACYFYISGIFRVLFVIFVYRIMFMIIINTVNSPKYELFSKNNDSLQFKLDLRWKNIHIWILWSTMNIKIINNRVGWPWTVLSRWICSHMHYQYRSETVHKSPARPRNLCAFPYILFLFGYLKNCFSTNNREIMIPFTNHARDVDET